MPGHPKFQTASDGALLLNFGEYGHEVEVAAISADGSRTLTVREVGKAEVWDTRTGARVGEICPDSPLRESSGTNPTTRPFQVFIESAALNRDGSIALLGLNDGSAGIFRVADGGRLATLYPPDEAPAREWQVIRAVDYSPDGSLALVGFPNRSVGVWSADGERLVAFLSGTERMRLVGRPFVRDTLVSSVAASPDNRRIFGGCVDMTAAVWELASGETVFEAMEHAEAVLTVFDSDDGVGWATTGGAVWFSRGADSPVKVISSGEHWAEARFRRGVILTRGFDGRVTRWDLEGDRQVLLDVAVSPSAGWSAKTVSLGFGEGDETFHPESGTRLVVRMRGRTTAIDREAQIVQARFSPKGDSVAIDGWTNALELWSVPAGTLLHAFPCPGGVGDFAFSHDGKLVAVGEIGHGGGKYPRQIFVYETASGRRVLTLSEHNWQVSRVAFSPDGRWLASIGDHLVLSTLGDSGWLRRRKTVRVEVDRVTAGVRYLSDGRLLVIDRGRARLFAEGGELRSFKVPVAYQTPWCVSDDEQRLAVAAVQGAIRFDIESGKSLGACLAPIPRPEQVMVPGVKNPRFTAAIWRTTHGVFLHQSDGPRGSQEPQRMSVDNDVVVPASDCAAVVRLVPEASMRAVVSFEGKMRAGRVVGRDVLLVNETGRVFRTAMD